MKTWKVTMSRVEYLAGDLYVEAETEEEARELALSGGLEDPEYKCVNADQDILWVEEEP